MLKLNKIRPWFVRNQKLPDNHHRMFERMDMSLISPLEALHYTKRPEFWSKRVR
jgi:hypothetical protein